MLFSIAEKIALGIALLAGTIGLGLAINGLFARARKPKSRKKIL